MPELPEVETVANHLRKLVTGARIVSATLLRARLAPHSSAESFAAMLLNASIERIHRRGKHILIDLDNRRTLMVHLRMSGRFMLLAEETDEPKFTHARFELDNGKKLLFQDQRHFGFMRIIDSTEIFAAKELVKLAPEPFSDKFTADYLKATATSSSRSIKEFLLDQTKVCGVGNIYASEAMFLARVSPRMKAGKLSRPKAVRLHQSIKDVLSETLALGATMPIIPENIGGSIYGDSDNGWRVYGREGEPCPSCSQPIIRIAQAGRSTFYCGKCQR
jgi:formamidopyrimidine-DNA glycosylase